MISIGIQIKRIRKSRKISQKDLANKINVTPIHLCGIENNKRVPTIQLLERISRVLKTDLVITLIDKE